MAAKKRGNGDGSIYQRANGKWIAAITVTAIDGKASTRTRIAKSKEHALLLLRELQRQYPTRRVTSLDRVTITDLCRRWLDVARKKLDVSTADGHDRMIELHITPAIGTRLIADVTPLLIEDWVTWLRDSDRGARTQLAAFRTLHAAFDYGIKIGAVAVNPCSVVDAPRYERQRIQIFSAEDVKAILNATKDTRQGPLYQLAFTTGLRQGELFGLRWTDVDQSSGTLRVERQAREYKGSVTIKSTKTSAGVRTITLTRATLESIRSMPRPMQIDAPLFGSARGTVVRRTNFRRRQWVPLLAKLEIPYRGFHHVRHTAATTMLRAGVPVLVVSGVLGHSKVSTTLDLYGHFVAADSGIAADVMEHLGG